MGCLDYAVLGIGVNVRQTQQQFPEELLPIVTSVEEVCGKVVPRSQLAAEILNQLEPLLPNPTAEEVLEEYRERSFLTGRKVSILQGGQARTAQVLGIDRKGRLVVQEEDGSRQALVSADRVLPLAKGLSQIRQNTTDRFVPFAFVLFETLLLYWRFIQNKDRIFGISMYCKPACFLIYYR